MSWRSAQRTTAPRECGQTEEKGALVGLKTVAMGTTATQLIRMHLLLTGGYRGERGFEKGRYGAGNTCRAADGCEATSDLTKTCSGGGGRFRVRSEESRWLGGRLRGFFTYFRTRS